LAQRNTQILGVEFASATFAVRGISNTQIISKARFAFEEFHTKFAQGYCEPASDEFWPPGLIKSKMQGWSRRRNAINKTTRAI
jgi:hypothetical protein